MVPAPGELLHVSEDPTITRFVPRRSATQQVEGEFVWALDAEHAPCYWFPRDCPRVTAWVQASTSHDDRLLLGGAARVHAVEARWIDVMRSVAVYAYRLPAGRFQPIDTEDRYAFVCDGPVDPLGPPELLGDLVELHARDGIELRALPMLGPFWRSVLGSTLAFSGIRLANADPPL